MTQRVVDAYARCPKLVSHLHLPVQAGSDRVLAAMKRGYTVLEFKSLVRKLRAARPDISCPSDFIVGFPARPRADFEEDHEADRGPRLRRVLQLRLQLAPWHAGRRPARRRPCQDVKLARLARLQSASTHAGHDQRGMVGSVQRILVEGPSKKDPTSWPAAPTTTGWSTSPATRALWPFCGREHRPRCPIRCAARSS